MKVLRVALILPVLLGPGLAHATFSIVAVDPATGEVGGAGASCISGASIINDCIEGLGAIHTQAYWNVLNQQNAHDRMILGDSPTEIIAYLIANDAHGTGCGMGVCDETYRQYGIVDLVAGGRSAAHTGSNNGVYANHILGTTYSIQGNILIDPTTYDVIRQMEIEFTVNGGPLAERLMAALQAANISGADRRCLSDGKPAISAFIKVVRIGDGANPYLDLDVSNTTAGENPIDILQGQYDAWKAGLADEPDLFASSASLAEDYLPGDGKTQTTLTVIPRNSWGTSLGPGRLVTTTQTGTSRVSAFTDNLDGTYTAIITAPKGAGVDTFTISVEGSGGFVVLDDQPTVEYYRYARHGGTDAGGCAAIRPGPGSHLGAWLPLLLLLLLLLRPWHIAHPQR
jgi:uncharacterized Ntn-hydrolase superfamily protein